MRRSIGTHQKGMEVEKSLTSTAQKRADLLILGRKRQQGAYPGYSNLCDFHDGGYETCWVTPYEISAGNVDSPIVFVLQDWASDESLRKPFDAVTARYGYTPGNRTDETLKSLVKSVYRWEFKDIFVTNLFPFIKHGSMSAPIVPRDLDKAFNDFCWPEIRIVQPRFVVCLGGAVYDTFARNLGGIPRRPRTVGTHFDHDGILIYHQYHPSVRPINASYAELVKQWQEMHSFQNSHSLWV